jgi:hypothetical protein
LIAARKGARCPRTTRSTTFTLASPPGDSVSEALKQGIEEFYSGNPLAVMEFGKPGLHNERIYTAEVFGPPDFEGSITIVHLFFGKFKVISMLSKCFEMPD